MTKTRAYILTILFAILLPKHVFAQGIEAEEANIIILPSAYYSHSTWEGISYDADMGVTSAWGVDTDVQDTPPADAQSRDWYAYDYTPTNGNFEWKETHAPYSTDATFEGMNCTQWGSGSTTSDIYIRRTFTLEPFNCEKVFLAAGHDDGESHYYINGTLVYTTGKNWTATEYVQLTNEQVALLYTDGRPNVIAIHVHNNYGGGYADCGIYGKPYEDKEIGNLPLGFVESWNARILFNPEGGYNGLLNNTESEIHGWERLYEAASGETYTISLPTAAMSEENARVQFHTPITIKNTNQYQVRVVLKSDKTFSGVRMILGESNNEDKELLNVSLELTAGEENTIVKSYLTGTDIDNLKMEFRFPTKEDNTNIEIKQIRIYNQTERVDLWKGTSYFNWFYYANPTDGKRIKDMAIEGRTETLSWTEPDFDDSMWTEAPMPIGNADYMPEVKTTWPGGENTNLWVRRDFTLKFIDPRSRYTLRVCHDDSYRIYVNGHLIDADNGWTDGKKYVSIPIPYYYLREGTNVIATYIQQNWGGKFYDCGMKVEENVYEDFDLDADPTQMVINEIQALNVDQYIDWSFNYGSWIELYNPTDKRISLAGMWVSTDSNNPYQYQLSQSAGVIPAKGFKTLFFDHNKEDGNYGETADRQVRLKLSSEGGMVSITNHDSTLINMVNYPMATARCSYARVTDGADTWGTTGTPTLSASNNTSEFSTERLPEPQPNVDTRFFTEPIVVKVPIPEGYTLRYTTDGSTPTRTNGTTSKSGIFTVSNTLILRLIFLADGYLPSKVVTRSYIKKEKDYYMPVISVTTAPENLYGDSIGVYVDGVNGIEGRNHGKSNRNMDWERPVNVEIMDTDGHMLINQEAEFKVSGGWSRHFMPASFKIKASKNYEGIKSLDAQLFPNKPYNKYKQILIRNGGNDNSDTSGGRLIDALTQQIIISSGYLVDTQDMQPIHVFFNGEYKGLFNLRETSNRYHGTANYGYDDDEMDAFEYAGKYVQTQGTRDAFENWLKISSEANDSAGYARLCDVVDIDEYTNYWAAVTYIGSSDWICNTNNVKGYRNANNGKFHLVLLDQDFGWSLTNSLSQLEGNRSNELLSIYNNTKKNKTWQKKFVDAYCLIDGSVFTSERCVQIGDSICDIMEQALAYEGRDPWRTFNRIRPAMVSESWKKAKMEDLRKNFGLPAGMNVTFKGNIPQASFRLNGQPVPLNTFAGTLFAPVSIEASAPAGYNFKGWIQTDADSAIVTTDHTLTLTDDNPAHYEALFEPIKSSALSHAGAHPVVINEVSAQNSIFQNDFFKRADWVELYNTTSEDIDLTGMYLSDTPENPYQFAITAAATEESSTLLPAHGYKIIWMDKVAGESQLHASFKLKNADEAMLLLTSADRTWTDTLRYNVHTGEESVGRYPDGGKRIYKMMHPTIAARNWLTESAAWLYGEDVNFDDSGYPTAIQEPSMAQTSPIIRTEYFSPDGIRIPMPKTGIVIIHHTHEDGSISMKKVVLSGK
ncbi:MAG: lamin tail domain-containing protein [Bacteroidaceae bacterium]